MQASSPELLVERFGVDELAAPRHEPSYNVAPRADVPVVADPGLREIHVGSWSGLTRGELDPVVEMVIPRSATA